MNLNNSPLVRGLGSQDAELVREVNHGNRYYKMLNKYGREVHINVELEADKLRRGFVHTDRQVYSDDMSTRVKAAVPVTPMEVMAKLAEKMVESNNANKEALIKATVSVEPEVKAEAPKNKGGRPRKVKLEE